MTNYVSGYAIIIIILAALPFSAEAKRFKWDCTYSKYASPEGVKNIGDFKIEFAFDDITEKAVMIGNNGLADLDIHAGSYGVTFMEKLRTGAVETTTITNNGSSIHSRHTTTGDDEI